MELENYISPELTVLLPILYVIGCAIKQSKIPDWTIPFLLGITSIILAIAWTLANKSPTNALETVKCVAFGIIQGVICAAVTVYSNNLIKQYAKKDGEEDA